MFGMFSDQVLILLDRISKFKYTHYIQLLSCYRVLVGKL